MTARRLGLLALLAALPLSGCEKLCDEGAVTWCPRSEDDELNHAPFVGEIQARLEAGTDPGAERLTAVFRADADDRDDDPIAYAWDLDGDGEFDKHGALVSHSYHRSARPRVMLRVTDFPRKLGAPGERRRTKVVAIADLALNHAPSGAAIDVQTPRTLYPGFLYATERASFSPDFSDPDVEGHTYRWRFGEDGEESREGVPTYRYRSAGVKTVRLRVTDPFGASASATRELEVRAAPALPIARFTVTPESPLVGEYATLDASASTPGDFELDVHWFEPGWDSGYGGLAGPVARVRYARPGQKTILLRVRDDAGFVSEATHTIRVRPNPEQNSPPTASFTVTPPAPFAGQPVRLDASASTDHEGPIARHQWDLVNSEEFAVDNGPEPVLTTTFATPGERLVRLRVTDAGGLTDSVWKTVVVRPPARARAARTRGPATRLPFSARLGGAPLREGQGELRRRGRRVSLAGVLGGGRVRARVIDPPGRATPAERALRRFLAARWRTRMRFTRDRRSGRLAVRAIALATVGRRSAVCMRIRVVARPGATARGRLRTRGGSRAGSRLHGAASFRVRLERDGTATAVGRLRARTGPKRPLPRRCRRLVPRGVR